jgi:hypothetical protein
MEGWRNRVVGQTTATTLALTRGYLLMEGVRGVLYRPRVMDTRTDTRFASGPTAACPAMSACSVERQRLESFHSLR